MSQLQRIQSSYQVSFSPEQKAILKNWWSGLDIVGTCLYYLHQEMFMLDWCRQNDTNNFGVHLFVCIFYERNAKASQKAYQALCNVRDSISFYLHND